MKSFLHIFAQLRAAYANKTSPEGLQLLARVYWRLILAAGFFVIVVSIALGALQLLAVLGMLGTTPSQDAALPVLIDKAKLEKTLEVYELRKNRFDFLQTSTSTFPDPSQ